MTRVPRFFLPGLAPSGRAVLPGEVARHALKTLRLKRGDLIRLFDGRGLEVEAEILSTGRREPAAGILSVLEPLDRGLPQRILVFSPPRGERLEWLVEKGTELGATLFRPVLWKRTPPRAGSFRVDRLEKIAASACEQCGRSFLPAFTPPVSLDRFLEGEIPGERILLERGAPLPAGAGFPGPATLVAGPEGGWEREEREALRERGFLAAGLGRLTLRIETALLAGLSLLSPRGENPGRGEGGGPP